MRIAIVSDTHIPRGTRVVPEACLAECRAADAILHCGDFVDAATVQLFRELGPPLHAVHGNVDGRALQRILPERLEVDLGGVKVGMVHIPGPGGPGRLERLRREFPGCDAVVFGHTHMPEHAATPDASFQVFNPGSPTERRRAPSHTMGLATIEDGRITFELLVVGGE
jgi:uncharacterized protein